MGHGVVLPVDCTLYERVGARPHGQQIKSELFALLQGLSIPFPYIELGGRLFRMPVLGYWFESHFDAPVP